jgi:hypothetical protein
VLCTTLTSSLPAVQSAPSNTRIPFAPGVVLTYVMHNLDEKYDREFNSTIVSVSPNAGVMHAVIDRFNRMLTGIPNDQQLRHVHYVRAIGTLSPEPDRYKNDWSNELHPTRAGFRRLAKRFEETINGLP